VLEEVHDELHFTTVAHCTYWCKFPAQITAHLIVVELSNF